MGSSLGVVWNDYKDYNRIILYLGIKKFNNPPYQYNTFYNHLDDIFFKLNIVTINDFWKKTKEWEEEGWSKEHIVDFYQLH